MSAVAIIPAKGTSRRVPGKNRKMFHGHPIIYYSIKVARESGLFSRVVVSTDDEWIGRYSEGCGATWYTRATELTEENVGTQEVAADVIRSYRAGDDPYEYACCIYPCAPMMAAGDLKAGFNWLISPAGVPPPYAYVPGYFYWGTTHDFLNATPLENGVRMMLPTDRYIDINTHEDWLRAELMYEALRREKA